MIIDGLNTFIRCFSAIPTLNEDGAHVGGVVGFLRSIGYAIRTIRPTRTIIVFDGKGGSNRRRKIFPEYKMGRKMSVRLNRTTGVSLTREDEHKMMIAQLNRVIEYLECLPLTITNVENVEADDVIGYCAKHLFKDKVTIMSTDKDFLQLVDNRIQIYSPSKKLMYDEERIKNEYGIDAKNFLLYRIMDGDKSDGIPGIKGAGLKTLLKVFPYLESPHQFTIEDIMKSSDANKDKYKICETIVKEKDQMFLNKKLMDLTDGVMSGNSRLRVKNQMDLPIQRLIKHKFQRMFLEDKMYQALPNLDSWLATTFNRLNQMAEKTNG